MKTSAAEVSSLQPNERVHLDHPGFAHELVLNNAIVGISFLVDRLMVWTNQRMTEMFGYLPGELDGKPVRTLYATQEDYEEVGRMYALFARDNRYTHERALVRKDGKIIWCLISGRMVNPADPHAGSVWVVQDISAKKRAEDQLKRANQRLEHTVERRTLNLRRTNAALEQEIDRRRSTERALLASRETFRAVFRHVPIGILVTSAEGEIVEANRPMQLAIGAVTRAELGQVVADPSRVVAGDGRNLSLKALIHEMTPGDERRVVKSHMKWRSLGGKPSHLDVMASRLSGHGLGAVFIFNDVTEQRRALERDHEQQNALAHAMRVSLMGQFASALAHELGQPLNACQSYLTGIRHRLNEELDSHPEVRDAFDHLERHLEQAGRIIHNVRRFVSRHPQEFEPTCVTQLIRETLDLLDPKIKGGGVSVSLDVADDLPHVPVNRVEIQQVLVNLIINAIEAMADIPPRGRHVTIRAIRERRTVSIQIADTGPGLAGEFRHRIFTPYFTTKPSGLGMGLMICRNIIESHGGSIRCQNPHGGRGASFKFTLPCAD